ncbi:hypothetical protein [Massilia cavernae]|uniref:Uncharacterized protein n=1 Tax=Massilia cavernae TaxID=2320864 RepID=A0A418Y161_9BURK|nr:hypothetical protein [Massilia cavernae]RJG19190.1 hypothetical protein D3872_08795 [Massilia cavernae]
MGIFRRSECVGALAALGADTVALRIAAPCIVPPGCVGVACDRQGVTHRVSEGERVNPPAGAAAWCFHPGPYTADLVPFEAAPEAGISLAWVVDSPDPRVGQQRFDLFLASECGERLDAAALAASVEAALRRELAQGQLDLPPCATLAEWDAFRAGFDELMYTRFGITVEHCAPSDLSGGRDYAAMLLARAAATTQAEAPPAAAAPPAPQAADDARALRRLFLELPRIAAALRMFDWPPGQFQRRQALLQRLGDAGLSVATMPSLELEAPGRPLCASQQARRIGHSMRAAVSLDEAWAMLARLKGGEPQAAIFDDAERIAANLEHDCAARRAAGGYAA